MSTIVTRIGKGFPLTNLELDTNFSNLNLDKLEISAFSSTANNWILTKSINDFSDVVITTPSNNQVLVWNSNQSKWVNQTVSVGSGLEGGSLEIVTFGSTTIDSFDTSLYSTVKYLIQATQGADVHTTELIVIHNGINAFTTEYGSLFTTELFTLDANIVNDILELNLISILNNTFVDFKRITLSSRLQIIDSGTLEGDLMLLSGLEDLMLGSGTIDLMDGDDNLLEGDLNLLSGLEDLMLGSGTIDLMGTNGDLLEGDLINSFGIEDLMLGSGTIDLMGTSGQILLQGDLANLIGFEDLLVGSGTIDLLN